MCHLLLSTSCLFFHFSNLFDCPASFTCLLSLSLSLSLSVCVSFFPHVSLAFLVSSLALVHSCVFPAFTACVLILSWFVLFFVSLQSSVPLGHLPLGMIVQSRWVGLSGRGKGCIGIGLQCAPVRKKKTPQGIFKDWH